jgi:hypothetical protein
MRPSVNANTSIRRVTLHCPHKRSLSTGAPARPRRCLPLYPAAGPEGLRYTSHYVSRFRTPALGRCDLEAGT